jgi:hypothetical protein
VKFVLPLYCGAAPPDFLASSEVYENQTGNNGKKAEYPESVVRYFMDLHEVGLDLFRKGEIGESLDNQYQPNDT